MGLDIRTPIGLMFSIIGGLLVIASLFLDSDVYTRSLGINVNLWWGLVMLVFGGLMLFFGTRDGATVHLTAESPEGLKIEAEEHRTGAEEEEDDRRGD
jgi:hypothetical protein